MTMSMVCSCKFMGVLCSIVICSIGAKRLACIVNKTISDGYRDKAVFTSLTDLVQIMMA